MKPGYISLRLFFARLFLVVSQRIGGVGLSDLGLAPQQSRHTSSVVRAVRRFRSVARQVRHRLKQLDGVFSASHKRGGESIKTWGQLGLNGERANLEIQPNGPARTHGMYTVFKEMVMENGKFRYDLKSEPVSTSIV